MTTEQNKIKKIPAQNSVDSATEKTCKISEKSNKPCLS